MTAIEEREATSDGLATPSDVSLFLKTARDHTDRPGDPQGRARAGLNAVLASRHDHGSIHAGLFNVRDRETKERLKEVGWQVVAVGTNPATGEPVYVLERAPSTQDGA